MNRNRLPIRLASSALALFAFLASPAATAQVGYSYVPVTPCRLVDTRLADGTNGGPILTSGAIRNVQVRGFCAVPIAAKAVALNMTSVSPSTAGHFILYPSGITCPNVSNLNFVANQPPIANFGIIALSTNPQDLSIVFGTAAPGTVHILLDVLGYYQ